VECEFITGALGSKILNNLGLSGGSGNGGDHAELFVISSVENVSRRKFGIDLALRWRGFERVNSNGESLNGSKRFAVAVNGSSRTSDSLVPETLNTIVSDGFALVVFVFFATVTSFVVRESS